MTTKQIKRVLNVEGGGNVHQVQITPTMAKNLLAANTDNRRLKNQHVNWLAAQMLADEWHQNGDTISFKENGELADGQHRLHAVIKSNKKQTFIVVLNLQKEAMATIDTGMNRSAADVLELNGIRNSSNAAAIVKRLLKMSKGSFRFDNGGKDGIDNIVSNQRILEFAKKNENYLYEVTIKAHACYQQFQMLTPSFYGVNYYNFALINATMANKFFDKLCSGVGLQREDAIFVFRKKIIDANASDVKIKNKALYFYVHHAWNAFFTGKSIKRLPGFKKDSKMPELAKAA